MNKIDRGYIQLYTGNGKGKTTAALGLSLRAACAGKKIFFAQFIKGMDYSELRAGEFLPNFEIMQFGRDCFIKNKPKAIDFEMAKKGLEIVKKKIASDKYDLIVLDELNIALHYGLLEIEEIVELLKNKGEKLEIVITGRYAKEEIIELADLVTEMREIKHYYNNGVPARVGIEK